MKRVLILSATHLCKNPRALKEATTLAEAGYDVNLLSLSLREDYERVDREVMVGKKFKRETVNLMAATTLAGFLARARTRLARAASRRIGWQSPESLGAFTTLFHRARAVTADLVIAHTEMPLLIAQKLAGAGRRVAVDLEDWYSEDLLPEDRKSRPLALLRAAEHFAVHAAKYVSVPSQRMADAVHARYGGTRPVVVRNTFPLQPDPRTTRPPGSALPRLVWFSQTIGRRRGLEPFLACWAATAVPSELHLIGDVRESFRDELVTALPADRRGRLHFHTPVNPETLPASLARFDVGLALEEPFPASRDTTISNKILQYLNAGLGIVATPTSGQREVMDAAPGCGVLVNLQETGATAAALDSLLGLPARVAAMQQAARRAAEREFNWEKDSAVLLASVEAAFRRA